MTPIYYVLTHELKNPMAFVIVLTAILVFIIWTLKKVL